MHWVSFLVPFAAFLLILVDALLQIPHRIIHQYNLVNIETVREFYSFNDFIRVYHKAELLFI